MSLPPYILCYYFIKLSHFFHLIITLYTFLINNSTCFKLYKKRILTLSQNSFINFQFVILRLCVLHIFLFYKIVAPLIPVGKPMTYQRIVKHSKMTPVAIA